MSITKTYYKRYRDIIFYGLLMATLVFLLKWMQWKFLIVDHSLEIYVGLIAVFFMALGIWIASHLIRPKEKTVVVEKIVTVSPNESFIPDNDQLKQLKLTQREYEVLQRMAKGHSNNEIAAELFLSLSTVKTHASNLFVKMDVTSRTKAIEKAKRLKITS